jgi:preprotein translocase subunit YajC
MVAASSGSPIFLFLILGLVVLWLVVIRPQKKRQNQQRQMIDELHVGDEVLTAGGIYGTISQIDDDHVVVEIAPKTEVRVARRAIAGVTVEPEEPEDSEEPEDEEEPAEAAESDVDPDGPIPAGEPSDEENRG